MQIFEHELASLRQLHDMPYNLPYSVPGHQGRMYDPTITRDSVVQGSGVRAH